MNPALLLAALASCPQDAKPIALFDGTSLAGWTADVPDNDGNPDAPCPFIVREGMLVSLGTPMGHLITQAEYSNYRLTVEWRWPKAAGNSGVIVHASKPRLLRNFLPQGIEAQLRSGDAGDFHLFGETLFKPGSTTERAGKNSTDNSERPVGEWNRMIVECKGDEIKVWVNGDVVNHGTGSSVTKGRIAIQSEGAEIEFRRIELTKL
jgi:hypothetical protein